MTNDITIDLDYIKLAAVTYGDPQHPPLLALHGWLDNAASFTRLAPLLKNHYIIAIDWPGHGLSEHRQVGQHYYLMDYVADVEAVRNYFQWSNFSILAHSLGAGVASIYAGIQHEYVDKLILIDGLGSFPHPLEETVNRAKQHLQAYQVLSIPSRHFTSKQQAAKLREKNSGLSADAALLIVERALQTSDQGFQWRHDPRLLIPSLLTMSEAQNQQFLQAISANCLMIHPDPGYGFRGSVMDQRLKLIKQLAHVELEGNHYPHLEQANKIAPLIQKYLDEA